MRREHREKQLPLKKTLRISACQVNRKDLRLSNLSCHAPGRQEDEHQPGEHGDAGEAKQGQVHY